ncbi:PEP-CTERM sorting domain-containing protein [Gloeocapsa sp. PCC 73106]|uniref:PEP-CTERM sorting domain-containing protein n=1 Tax=Gloeocapsa sp. PCC 73106 TaxID=102232 RepID=UPI0002AC3764|nr:PEP-CTERM sorting domain-containing protein [Gloeocapsa sp. PCC 73106]ELR96911.1 hypothetical protein GLO73106DRAFT_00007120 [Gloeocapsa sp. PCC 73106]
MKNISLAVLTASASLLAFGSVSAEAATFTYNFNSPRGTLTSPQVFSPNPVGPNLTVSAFKDLPDLEVGTFDINFNGIGVAGNPGGQATGRSFRNQEAIELNFPGVQQYRLVNVTFAGLSTLSQNRDISLIVDAGSEGSVNVPGATSPTVVPGSSFGSDSGNVFVFTPTGNGDIFRLRSAEFEVVPEPLTILGTGLALASMPLMKKARQQKSE